MNIGQTFKTNYWKEPDVCSTSFPLRKEWRKRPQSSGTNRTVESGRYGTHHHRTISTIKNRWLRRARGRVSIKLDSFRHEKMGKRSLTNIGSVCVCACVYTASVYLYICVHIERDGTILHLAKKQQRQPGSLLIFPYSKGVERGEVWLGLSLIPWRFDQRNILLEQDLKLNSASSRRRHQQQQYQWRQRQRPMARGISSGARSFAHFSLQNRKTSRVTCSLAAPAFYSIVRTTIPLSSIG